MAWLRRDEDDVLRRKREEIEASLRAIVAFDVTDFAEIDPRGNIVSFDWHKIREHGVGLGAVRNRVR
jgi:hypothetical protein